MPAQKHLDIWRGNTFDAEFRLKDSTGAAVNLTGAKLVFTAAAAGAQVLRKDTDSGSGFIITNAVGGIAALSLTAAETRALPTGQTILYEVERWAGGKQKTIVTGKLVVGGVVNVDA